MTTVVIVVILLTASTVVSLWWAGTSGLTGSELVQARLDALRTGLSIGIGAGGIFALYLASRRQQATEVGLVQKDRDQADVALAYSLQERVAKSAENDAIERRTTDLYSKSIEQLGSTKAAVRLGALYALERIAGDNGSYRASVVNIMCAYLRMPFDAPAAVKGNPHEEVPGVEEDDDTREIDTYIDPWTPTYVGTPVAAEDDATKSSREELQVRLTAQRILSSHLRPPSNGEAGDARSANAIDYGEDVTVDLTDAILVNFDFSECVLDRCSFDGAVFYGPARFMKARFSTGVSFNRAKFYDAAFFIQTVFLEHTSFQGVKFFDMAIFDGAEFKGQTSFSGSSFYSAVRLANGKFESPAELGGNTVVYNLSYHCIRAFPEPWRVNRKATKPEIGFLVHRDEWDGKYECTVGSPGSRRDTWQHE